MTNTRTFAIETRLGHSNTTTSTLHRHPKLKKATETYLFDLLLRDILMVIDLLASGLEHHDKLKAVITKIHPLFHPILFAVPQEIWAPYHNFNVYGSWYNQCSYTWAYRPVPTNMRLQYQNILASYSMVIETLTQRHLGLNKIVATCQHITWDKSSYIPYFNQTILDSYHARLELPVFTGW